MQLVWLARPTCSVNRDRARETTAAFLSQWVDRVRLEQGEGAEFTYTLCSSPLRLDQVFPTRTAAGGDWEAFEK